ncbi:unnamed protein product [Lactuca virosa]|uniref:Uncharacterized protein n=1 Tax=Lactuca virosa TaxID=75947 RepID=A0AAU9NEG1_9ASTR|nr:unnamed protein product [Lactuca virosa]
MQTRSFLTWFMIATKSCFSFVATLHLKGAKTLFAIGSYDGKSRIWSNGGKIKTTSRPVPIRTRSLIDATPEWWEEKIKENKEYAKFRDIDLSIFDMKYANFVSGFCCYWR